MLVFTQGSETVQEKSVSVILLAGGKGKRMGVSINSYPINYSICYLCCCLLCYFLHPISISISLIFNIHWRVCSNPLLVMSTTLPGGLWGHFTLSSCVFNYPQRVKSILIFWSRGFHLNCTNSLIHPTSFVLLLIQSTSAILFNVIFSCWRIMLFYFIEVLGIDSLTAMLVAKSQLIFNCVFTIGMVSEEHFSFLCISPWNDGHVVHECYVPGACLSYVLPSK